MLPWATPDLILCSEEETPFARTICFLFWTKEMNQSGSIQASLLFSHRCLWFITKFLYDRRVITWNGLRKRFWGCWSAVNTCPSFIFLQPWLELSKYLCQWTYNPSSLATSLCDRPNEYVLQCIGEELYQTVLIYIYDKFTQYKALVFSEFNMFFIQESCLIPIHRHKTKIFDISTGSAL